jgi:hypothetical protein
MIIWLAAILAILVSNVATAQTQRSPSSVEAVLTFFYKDPRPERLLGYFDEFRKLPASRNWQAYPPSVGFFAVVFRAHENWVDRLIPARPDAKIVETLAAALQIAGYPQKSAGLRLKFKDAGSDEILHAELAGLPARLEELQIVGPTHLDLLWGASFASGDARHVRRIIDFYASTADQSEQIAQDTARVVIAMAGGPQEPLQGLRAKYGENFARQIIYAAVALWAVQSNARQHAYVDQAMTQFIKERQGTPAATGLAVLRQAR